MPQVWAYTKKQQVMSDDNCLDAAGKQGEKKYKKWIYGEQKVNLYKLYRTNIFLARSCQNA
jgi:hypothetical protein